MRLLGWKFAGNLPAEPRFVIAWAPHTSYMDWPVCISGMLALRLKSSWMVAHGFFWWPLSLLMKRLGGIPVVRHSSHNIVAQMVDYFTTRDQFVLAIAPEGTRKKVGKWKTGFLHIAKGASVPIMLMSLDYATKTLALGPTLNPTDDIESDMKKIQAHFRKFKARYPAQAQ
ncbi:MAG: 1-acyl-sn-glycerol-3-phosphate acyltransferase [Acidiferrobacterales bacterium]